MLNKDLNLHYVKTGNCNYLLNRKSGFLCEAGIEEVASKYISNYSGEVCFLSIITV